MRITIHISNKPVVMAANVTIVGLIHVTHFIYLCALIYWMIPWRWYIKYKWHYYTVLICGIQSQQSHLLYMMCSYGSPNNRKLVMLPFKRKHTNLKPPTKCMDTMVSVAIQNANESSFFLCLSREKSFDGFDDWLW